MATPPDLSGAAILHWRRTRRLAGAILVIWLIAGFGVHLFAPALNHIHFWGFPLGFFLAAQGSLVVFVLLLLWYVRAQHRIDRDAGLDRE